jgi:hypothetical protein
VIKLKMELILIFEKENKTMKKLSILIALVLCITIGGVYATWTYTQSTDVADLNPTVALSLTEATFAGTYGTYSVDTTGLTLAIDPAPGSTHTTSLQMSGKIVVSFTPHVYASTDVKENGVITTYQFSLTNDNWVFDDGHDNLGSRPIVVITHAEKHNVTWSEPDENGVLKFEILDISI